MRARTEDIWAGEIAVQDILIDWGALEDAFETTMHGVRSYLHRATGAVLRVVDGVADPLTLMRIAADADYLRIEPVSSEEQYSWMERFIPTVEDPEFREKLSQAIVGKGAFRRFRDLLSAHPEERECWFAFRAMHLRIKMGTWLSAHAIHPVDAPISMPGAPSATRAFAAPAARRPGRLRQNLCRIAEDLDPRDLEALTALAEFFRAYAQSRLP